MPLPRIGITTRTVVDGDREFVGVELEYVNAVVRAGGLPLELPGPTSMCSDDVLDAVDALILTGGGDIDPRCYRRPPSAQVGGVDRQRDDWELDLAGRAVDEAVPLLGICRGCQILNVVRGGTLIQHLPDVTTVEHLVVSPRDRISHVLAVEPGSLLAEIVGPDRLEVNTIHHQAVDGLGSGLDVGARASDGVVESIELRAGPALGVQWHPENLTVFSRQLKLFDWLVRQAAAVRTVDVRTARAWSVAHG